MIKSGMDDFSSTIYLRRLSLAMGTICPRRGYQFGGRVEKSDGETKAA
jgi:hypothetical protein